MEDLTAIKGMHVGEFIAQSGTFLAPADDDLIFCKQIGIDYISAIPKLTPGFKCLGLEEDGYWKSDALIRFREYVESFGLKLAATSLPLGPFDIQKQRWSSIMLGTPERDRDIEQICKCIAAAGKAGIPLLTYDLSLLGVVRNNGWKKGRGNTLRSYFDYEEIKDGSQHPVAPISVEQCWERIDYLIQHIIPVAEEYKVRMGCHPQDPPMPPGVSYRGLPHVLGNMDGLKQFINLHTSPYHGLLFCQGCIAEGSNNPEQIYEAIRYFGSRNKIFWVHFRNIHGGYLRFEETFPDEGDIDMLKALRTYKEVGYNGVLVPDHIPHSYLDSQWGHRAHAFCVGYMKGLIQAIRSESD